MTLDVISMFENLKKILNVLAVLISYSLALVLVFWPFLFSEIPKHQYLVGSVVGLLLLRNGAKLK